MTVTAELPEWLRARRPLTDDEIRDGVAAARRYLERSTPDMAVEQQRLILALADRVSELEEAIQDRDDAAWERSSAPERDA